MIGIMETKRVENSGVAKNDYSVDGVVLSTNGCNELYFDVKWSGKELD